MMAFGAVTTAKDRIHPEGCYGGEMTSGGAS